MRILEREKPCLEEKLSFTVEFESIRIGAKRTSSASQNSIAEDVHFIKASKVKRCILERNKTLEFRTEVIYFSQCERRK